MKDKQTYRAMTVDQIVALESDEERRDLLERLVREHTDDDNIAEVLVLLERALDEDAQEDLEELDRSDDDEVLTELLDRSTDDGLADVLRKLKQET